MNKANKKLNFMKAGKNIMKLRQIELRDGRVYMRYAQRGIITIRQVC